MATVITQDPAAHREFAEIGREPGLRGKEGTLGDIRGKWSGSLWLLLLTCLSREKMVRKDHANIFIMCM